MTIIYEGYGNVLNHDAQTITCPVNTVGVMGKGLALSMRNKFPKLLEYYKNLCVDGDLFIGKLKTFKIETGDESEKQVLLFPTKDHWKNDSDLSMIEEGLQYLANNYEKLGITSLAMVPIGCGCGNLNYSTEVKQLLFKYLDPLPIEVSILHRNPNT